MRCSVSPFGKLRYSETVANQRENDTGSAGTHTGSAFVPHRSLWWNTARPDSQMRTWLGPLVHDFRISVR